MSWSAAQVLHPSAMVPCIDANIPVYVRNIFNPAFAGTVIQVPLPPRTSLRRPRQPGVFPRARVHMRACMRVRALFLSMSVSRPARCLPGPRPPRPAAYILPGPEPDAGGGGRAQGLGHGQGHPRARRPHPHQGHHVHRQGHIPPSCPFVTSLRHVPSSRPFVTPLRHVSRHVPPSRTSVTSVPSSRPSRLSLHTCPLSRPEPSRLSSTGSRSCIASHVTDPFPNGCTAPAPDV